LRTAAGWLCLFCRKWSGFSVDFWADAPWPPGQRRAGAIPRPQMSIGGNARVMKNLPESS
jgi:hypothetical protein